MNLRQNLRTAANMHVSGDGESLKRTRLKLQLVLTIVPTDRLEDVHFGIHPNKDEDDHDTNNGCTWYHGEVAAAWRVLKVRLYA